MATFQTQKSLNEKIHHWLQGSKGHLKIICALQIEKGQGYHVFISIIRPRVTLKLLEENPKNYLVEPHRILDRVEVFPTAAQASFDITIADMLPKGSVLDPSALDQRTTIKIRDFWRAACQAVNAAVEKERARSSSPYDTDQEAVSTPINSSPSEPQTASGDEPMYSEYLDDPFESESSEDEPSFVIEDE